MNDRSVYCPKCGKMSVTCEWEYSSDGAQWSFITFVHNCNKCNYYEKKKIRYTYNFEELDHCPICIKLKDEKENNKRRLEILIQEAQNKSNPSLDSYTGGGIEWLTSEEYISKQDDITRYRNDLSKIEEEITCYSKKL